jgi:hypothetical protein
VYNGEIATPTPYVWKYAVLYKGTVLKQPVSEQYAIFRMYSHTYAFGVGPYDPTLARGPRKPN